MEKRLLALAGAAGVGVIAFVGVMIGIGGGVAAAGDEEFRISGTTLTAYLGTDAYVEIPDSVTVIGDEAFAGNETLTGITIPDSVTEISYNAFKDCTALEAVTISDNVEKVGPGAFEGCTALSTVEIGENVSSWGTGVFIDCTSLEKVILDDDNRYLTYYNGAIYNGSMTMLYEVLPARKGENYVMPETVEEIDAYAFWNLLNTVNVMLSENVDTVPKYAMTNMGTVENVVILSGTTKISENAFANNESLAQVAVPDTVTEIEANAFYNCLNLKIYTTRGSDAAAYGKENDIEVIYTAEYPTDFLDSNEDLEEMPDLGDSDSDSDSDSNTVSTTETTTVTVTTEDENGDEAQSGDEDAAARVNESGFANAQDYVHPLDAPEPDEVIGKTVIVADDAVFLMNNQDGQVYGVPDGVTADVLTETQAAQKEQESADGSTTAGTSTSLSYDESNIESETYIPQRKYYQDSSLVSYEIADTVKVIGRLAFAQSGLKSIDIPKSVERIEYGAFLSCADLVDVTIPDTVQSIATKAFEGTAWLSAWKSGSSDGGEDDFLIVGDGILLAYRGSGEHVQIPDGVRIIGSEAFKGHDEILDVEIPDSVTRINAEAFRNCSQLTGLTGCGGLETVIRGAFYGTQISESEFS